MEDFGRAEHRHFFCAHAGRLTFGIRIAAELV